MFPERVEELTSIPGIGVYTAAAVLFSVHGKPAHCHADTNVLRVLARVSGAKLKRFVERARRFFGPSDP